jgi:hypothetical protein
MVGNSDSSGGVAYPAFSGKNKKKGVGGNPWKEPIMRQKHNLGDVTDAPTNQVDMKPALKRGGSIAMGESFDRKINEAVDEGIGNWLKGAALGGMMAFSPMNANAQSQNYQQQQKDSVEWKSDFAKQLKKSGYSDDEIKKTKKELNPFSIMYKNSKSSVSPENGRILEYLINNVKSISSSKSSDNIKCFSWKEYDERQKYISQFDEETAKGYKCFYFNKDGYDTAVIMPINYTLQDVKKEIGTFFLDDFDIQ